MELKVHFRALPQGMGIDELMRGLEDALEEDGWLTGSAAGPEGGWVELELEDERRNPKFGIIAVKNYLQSIKMPAGTAMELSGHVVGVYE